MQVQNRAFSDIKNLKEYIPQSTRVKIMRQEQQNLGNMKNMSNKSWTHKELVAKGIERV